MLRHSRLGLIMSLWDTPITEQIPMLHYWKHVDGKTGANFSQSIPRSVNGSIESIQPRTQELVRWFPYRNEYLVNNKQVPSFMDVLHTHYFPPTPTDDERVAYVAEKSGRKPIEIAAQMFQMRRLRLAICQSLRDKIKGKWVRQPIANWTPIEKNYLDTTLRAAQVFGADFYSNQNFDPYVCYSPTYGFAETVDMVFNKQIRTVQQYLLIEVVVHNTIPRSRLPGVKGVVKEPISHLEPCLYDAIKLKLEVMAEILRAEEYVTDNVFDTGHAYQGAIVHVYKGLEYGEVLHEIVLVQLDKEMGRKWLRHWKTEHLSKNNKSYEDKLASPY